MASDGGVIHHHVEMIEPADYIFDCNSAVLGGPYVARKNARLTAQLRDEIRSALRSRGFDIEQSDRRTLCGKQYRAGGADAEKVPAGSGPGNHGNFAGEPTAKYRQMGAQSFEEAAMPSVRFCKFIDHRYSLGKRRFPRPCPYSK
jgi:hypothetical protein